MKRLIGFGIFALIFSLNLFTLGAQEAAKPSQIIYLLTSSAEQDQVEVKVSLSSPEGILQSRSETNELQQTVRRFPLAASLLFLLSHSPETDSPAHLLPELLSFSLPKDRLVSYHILRI